MTSEEAWNYHSSSLVTLWWVSSTASSASQVLQGGTSTLPEVNLCHSASFFIAWFFFSQKSYIIEFNARQPVSLACCHKVRHWWAMMPASPPQHTSSPCLRHHLCWLLSKIRQENEMVSNCSFRHRNFKLQSVTCLSIQLYNSGQYNPRSSVAAAIFSSIKLLAKKIYTTFVSPSWPCYGVRAYGCVTEAHGYHSKYRSPSVDIKHGSKVCVDIIIQSFSYRM